MKWKMKTHVLASGGSPFLGDIFWEGMSCLRQVVLVKEHFVGTQTHVFASGGYSVPFQSAPKGGGRLLISSLVRKLAALVLSSLFIFIFLFHDEP